jgi:hypothetical protein
MKKLAAIAVSAAVLASLSASTVAASSGLTFLPCSDSPAPRWVLMPHPPVCIEWRQIGNRKEHIELTNIHWHNWGAGQAVGHGRWAISAEFGAEESAAVTLTAYRRVNYPKEIDRGYTRLKLETEAAVLPSPVVLKLPTFRIHSESLFLDPADSESAVGSRRVGIDLS